MHQIQFYIIWNIKYDILASKYNLNDYFSFPSYSRGALLHYIFQRYIFFDIIFNIVYNSFNKWFVSFSFKFSVKIKAWFSLVFIKSYYFTYTTTSLYISVIFLWLLSSKKSLHSTLSLLLHTDDIYLIC